MSVSLINVKQNRIKQGLGVLRFWKLTLLFINENIMFDRTKKIINGNKCCKTKIGIDSKSNCMVRTKLLDKAKSF